MCAPCVLLPNKILSMRAPFLYINVTHVSNSDESSRVHYANIVYNQEGTPKMKHMLIFWEMRDSSMHFTPILPKPSHHTIHKVYLREHNSFYRNVWVTTRYSYSKRCDTFCQDCTFLEECIPRNTRDAYD